MKIAIVEDNEEFIKIIENKFNESHFNYDITSYTNGEDYRCDIEKKDYEYDIVIMDIELNGESGIDLANVTNCILPYCQIIYLTAYNQYVSDVYETEHTYFINKKNIDHYLPLALHKAVKNVTKRNAEVLNVSWNKVTEEIRQQDIIFIERNKRVTYIYVVKGNYYKTSKNIDEIYSMLNQDFIRNHESYLLNMKYISVINKNEVILTNGKIIPLSRKYNAKLKIEYNRFLASQL